MGLSDSELFSKDRKNYLYTALFCEENIWHLVQQLKTEGFDIDSMTVLLLSNPQQQIVLFNQSCRPVGESVIWDYHVILQLEKNNQQWICDFDSLLNFPVSKKSYFSASFPHPGSLQEQYQMFIRSIPATSYLQHFSSDRSHMRDVINAEQFPSYPPILVKATDLPITLTEYCDMRLSLFDGSKVSLYSC